MIRWEQAWPTLLSGRNGSVRWRCRLDLEHDETRIYPVGTFSHAVAELNDDGTCDVVLAQLTTGDGVSWAYNLRAAPWPLGRGTRRHALDPPRRKEDVMVQPGSSLFFAEDIDGDGKAEVVVPERTAQAGQNTGFPSVVLDGATGRHNGGSGTGAVPRTPSSPVAAVPSRRRRTRVGNDLGSPGPRHRPSGRGNPDAGTLR